ncbi:hypothetical protein HDU91_001536 [Kappamyces sp. JEL0680]|nr:hypothetical protein HDU91_001536 [Kappamyces sp. JEL0680]
MLSQGVFTADYLESLAETADSEVADADAGLDQKLLSIQASVRKLSQLIARPEGGKDCNEQRIKCLMELIESRILVFKAEQRDQMQQLAQVERLLFLDIKGLEERSSRADYLGKTAKFPAASPSGLDHWPKAGTMQSGLLPEVVQFQSFVDRHGHEDGWDPTNHAGFLRLRQKHGVSGQD